jgi:hypothetical protein
LQKVLWNYPEPLMLQDICWSLIKLRNRCYLQRSLLSSCCWAARLWATGSSGGILFLPEEKELTRRKMTGNKVVSFCHQMIIMNSFRCRKTDRVPQHHPLRKCFRKIKRCLRAFLRNERNTENTEEARRTWRPLYSSSMLVFSVLLSLTNKNPNDR